MLNEMYNFEMFQFSIIFYNTKLEVKKCNINTYVGIFFTFCKPLMSIQQLSNRTKASQWLILSGFRASVPVLNSF